MQHKSLLVDSISNLALSIIVVTRMEGMRIYEGYIFPGTNGCVRVFGKARYSEAGRYLKFGTRGYIIPTFI